ncbi:MAG TPA: hypothetical protein VFV66_35630 [Nonomuraea sp.]|nr:hypothetical protein [Nonomuraea sp.]
MLTKTFQTVPRRGMTADDQVATIVSVDEGSTRPFLGDQATDRALTYRWRSRQHQCSHNVIISHSCEASLDSFTSRTSDPRTAAHQDRHHEGVTKQQPAP